MPVVGLLSLELHFPGARSLKDKRSGLRSLIDRLRRHNVGVAEIDHQDLWQRTRLGIVAVGSTRQGVERQMQAVLDEADRRHAGLVVGSELEWLA